MRKILTLAVMAMASMSVFAQSGTNSPYSQYGLGELSDRSGGFNRGMNGLAYGLRKHNQINTQNPASYSAIDSLSFIFDAGLGLQLTNFSENGYKKNAQNADIEYVIGGFRACKHVGIGFGILPYTNVGYNYQNTRRVNDAASTESANTTYTNTYDGEGGVHEVFLGVGVEPIRNLSLGVNASYLWGGYTRTVLNSYSDTYVNTLSRKYSVDIRSYDLSFGLQWVAPVSKQDWVTLGLTYGLGHSLNADPECLTISTNSQTSVADTAKFVLKDVLDMPHRFGAGLAYNHNNKLTVGVDYQLQQWGKLAFPQYQTSNGVSTYVMQNGLLKDRQKFTLGFEYCKDERYHGFFNRLHYRAGVSYATPYYKVNGQDGPKEISASLGLGIPIVNNYNNRSILNISAQWVNLQAPGMLKENTFRINVGLTFNERWFAKFKVE